MAASKNRRHFENDEAPWGRSSDVRYCAKFDWLTLLETNEERQN